MHRAAVKYDAERMVRRKLGAEPVYLTSAERRKLDRLLKLSDSQIENLLRQSQPAAALAKPKKSRSVRDENLARHLAQLAGERGQARLAADLRVSEKALRRWLASQQFGKRKYVEIRRKVFERILKPKRLPRKRQKEFTKKTR